MRLMLHSLAGGLLWATVAAAQAQVGVTTTPTFGRPGLSVSVAGTGFSAAEAIDVYVDTTDTTLLVSNSSGVVGGSLTIPLSAGPGLHTVTAVGRRSGTAAQSAFTVTTPWTQFGYGVAHHGWNPYENTLTTANVSQLGQLWASNINGGGGTPAVNLNKLFVGTTAGVKALTPGTGVVQWTAIPNEAFYGAPTKGANGVYIGSASGNLYALAGPTGAVLWRSNLGGQFYASPTIVGDTIYIGSYASNVLGTMYAIQASIGNVIWSFAAGGGIDTSAAVVNGIVYFGSYDKKLYALDAQSGALKWTYTTGAAVESSPVFANNVIYFGSDDQNIYALNAVDGTLIWSYATGGAIYATAAIAAGTLYCGSADGKMYAFDPLKGGVRWSLTTRGVVRTAAVAGGVVYFTGGSSLYAVNAASGAVLASGSTGPNYFGGPAISDGVLYLSANSGPTYAFSALGGENNAMPRQVPNPSTLRPDMNLVAVR